MTQPSAKAAVVELNLGDRTLVLTPTLRAARDINSKCGSLGEAMRGAQAMNIAVYGIVIQAGAGLDDAEAEALGEELFAHGLAKLTGPVARFLMLCLTGGREPEKDKKKAADKGN